MIRRRWLWLGLGLGATALVGGLLWAREVRWFRAELDRAKSELLMGYHSTAALRLTKLSARWPGRGEVDYHLGLCELAGGRVDSAMAAWARVRPDSPYAGWAAVHRSGAEMKRGRLAEAEECLVLGVRTPGSHIAQARWELVRLLRLQGRFDEARRHYREGQAEWPDVAAALAKLYRLDTEPFPAEGVRRLLEEAARRAPEDDRVWLGRAHLATRAGQFTEADRWLAACLRRRPDDPAVWRARLEWTQAADRPDDARQALEHIPADDNAPRRALALRAWFASRRGDHEAERRALEDLRDLDPGDARALDRLAELALASGRADQAATYRRRKVDLELDRDAYAKLLASGDPTAHAGELARLAGALGRRFDAEGWSALAAGRRIPSGKARVVTPTRRTLADLLPDLTAPRTPAPAPSEPDEASLRFVDDAEAAGLRFVHDSGGSPGRLIPPVTASGGVGLLDYDGDGWLDVYAVQGGPFPPDPGSAREGDRLFRNRGDGTFEDVTEPSGLGAMPRGYGHGVAVADYDNDGHPDLFVTRWRSYALYRNRGDGTFEDATDRAGLGGGRDWPTSAAFADLDDDGDLDLYVCHYLAWDEQLPRACSDPDDPAIYHCNPRDFEALSDHVFRNDGGRFVDVTTEAGFVDPDGRGLGVVAADLDDDHLVDLFVANDTTANYLFRNLGGLRFEERAIDAGVAANASGGYQAGMGVACGDLDGDGRPDLAVTNFFNESTSFFRNLGRGFFADHTAAVGLAAPSRDLLGFGVAFLDADDDGRLDLMTANGHVHDGRPQFPWAMPVQLLTGGDGGRLTDASRRAGPPFGPLHLGRGLAVGDLDNDGRLDALVLSQDEPIAYLHNRSRGGHSLTLRLEGRASNRDGVGARVEVRAGGRRQVAHRFGGGSYQSAGDPRPHFGLGGATRVESIEVRWPSGRLDRHEDLAADTGYLLIEGDRTARPLDGWRR